MSSETTSTLTSESELASIPMAQGGLSRLAIARLESARVPVAPLLRRVGLTLKVIAEPEERLSVRSQISLLNEAAIALKDDCLGFTLARDFDLREIGLVYYVMASSGTLGSAQGGSVPWSGELMAHRGGHCHRHRRATPTGMPALDRVGSEGRRGIWHPRRVMSR
jgi:hypothetical protein